jgi:hypothetical protein
VIRHVKAVCIALLKCICQRRATPFALEVIHEFSSCPISSHSAIRSFNSARFRSSSRASRVVSSALTKFCNEFSHAVIAASRPEISSSNPWERSCICLRLMGFKRFDLSGKGSDGNDDDA